MLDAPYTLFIFYFNSWVVWQYPYLFNIHRIPNTKIKNLRHQLLSPFPKIRSNWIIHKVISVALIERLSFCSIRLLTNLFRTQNRIKNDPLKLYATWNNFCKCFFICLSFSYEKCITILWAYCYNIRVCRYEQYILFIFISLRATNEEQ